MRQITNDERVSALNNAIASVEMEGFEFADGEKELCMAALAGKITKGDFIKNCLKCLEYNKVFTKCLMKNMPCELNESQRR